MRRGFTEMFAGLFRRHGLAEMFAGLFRKQGFEVVLFNCLDIVEFENFFVKGMVLFDKKKKVHKVRWKCKEGFILFDVPMCPGYVSAEFKSAGELLNFLQRRLVCKKQKTDISCEQPF